MALVAWSSRVLGQSSNILNEKLALLDDLKKANGDGHLGDHLQSVEKEVDELLVQDEVYWRQRSRATWLAVGNKNTKFFHQYASHCKKKNQVVGLKDDMGRWHTDDAEVGHLMESYSHTLFTTSNSQHMEQVLESVKRRVTPDINYQLCLPFSGLEVYQAVFQMHPSKSSGPDDMSCFFFQTFWHNVGEDVIAAVLSVLNSGYFFQKINFTYIVLIPKIPNPRTVADFRPISLCNVVYKIISKVLANRLKGHLDTIISYSQSAFVPGRLIINNVTVAYELLHGLKAKRVGKKGQIAVKLNMSKAYDRVEWNFPEGIMYKLGFEGQWINLIMACLKSVSYAILFNGEPHGLITPSQGIRQGDPLSPYLFLLCAEGLSCLFRKVESDNLLHGVSFCRGGPRVSHLLFANNSIIFCDATILECERLGTLLDQYEGASGQQVNR
jgi:hypothetical protein